MLGALTFLQFANALGSPLAEHFWGGRNVTATFISPSLSHDLVQLFTTPSALAEVSLLLWLLARGLVLPAHDTAADVR